MPVARRALARLCGEGVVRERRELRALQRSEAATRMRELEQAMRELQGLERAAGRGLAQAAHDLRGTVGIISNASAMLEP